VWPSFDIVWQPLPHLSPCHTNLCQTISAHARAAIDSNFRAKKSPS
jgi:hypothetical protein